MQVVWVVFITAITVFNIHIIVRVVQKKVDQFYGFIEKYDENEMKHGHYLEDDESEESGKIEVFSPQVLSALA